MKQPRKTPTAEQKKWLKENGYTEAQMDAFWQENIDTNFIIRNLNSHGMSWRDMNISCVSQLPTQKERDLKAIAEREEKERAEKEAAEKKKQEEQYYKDHFEELMVAKIANKENLTERELQTLVWNHEVERTYGENRRWSRYAYSIIKLLDKFYSLEWDEGLTEYQENEFYNQPVEVIKKTYEKTITVTEWVNV